MRGRCQVLQSLIFRKTEEILHFKTFDRYVLNPTPDYILQAEFFNLHLQLRHRFNIFGNVGANLINEER